MIGLGATLCTYMLLCYTVDVVATMQETIVHYQSLVVLSYENCALVG